MIRHPKKNGNKKNVATLRETIIARVAKHSRYPLDLYNTCARGSALTNPEFRQLLNDMHAEGDIHINTDNLVLLPKPPPDVPEPKPPPEAPTPPREIENSTDNLVLLPKPPPDAPEPKPPPEAPTPPREIENSTDNLVLLPKPPPDAPEPKPPPEAPTPPHEIENSTDTLLIDCLVNRSHTLKYPKQKKSLKNSGYYAHRNYKTEQIPLDSVCEETLLKGFHIVPGSFEWLDKQSQKRDDSIIVRKTRISDGECVSETKSPDRTGKMKEGKTTTEHIIRDGDAWRAQQLFLIEFDDTTESTPAEFIAARPFLRENAWLVTESIRSGYDDPHDEKCNGQLRPRIVLCMPRAVNTTNEREWVSDALVNALPGCDKKSAISIPNGGLGKVGAEHVKIGKIVDTDWFNAAIDAGKQREAAEAAEDARLTEQRKRKQAERAAMGFTEREGELPLEALAKSDPSHFLESLGLSRKSESGRYQHWGRTEKQGDIALSVWLSERGNWQIRVFANSIPLPPGVSGAMPFARFYCYHEFNTDTEGLQPDSTEWKDLNAQLANSGYGTWLSDDEFNALHATPTQTPRNSNDIRGLEPVTTLPPDHPLLTSAPPVEVRESPSFRHFSPEERAVVKDVLSLDPNAGWHGQIPVFTTRYEYLHPLTQKFARNGQPSAVEKRRVWNTQFGSCEVCGAITAQWVDRYLLTAGLYCDGCHKDYHLGSYLELELNRKLPNSIVSEYQGFLGDDPEFADFRLWQPGIMTHLGAGMATGKSTEIYKQMIAFAIQGLGKGIIAVPTVSLARSLAHYLRRRDGYRSWGLWHEGCHKADKFIGDFGAIVCLPSLPQAVKSANDGGVQRLYIAIDEVDFCYNLLSVSLEQARAVKKCLRDALNTTGLVVSGQTESTLSLEALAEELGCEQVQGFYNTAKPADGHVVMHKYPNIEGKSNAIVCGTIDDIYDAFKAGQNAYNFCATRRDCDVIADVFQSENPVIYNAYTKGDPRADAFLRNQKLTDTRLFIGTSAAGVGISILDPKAKTVIASSLIYGSRDASMLAQKGVRDRGRRGGSYHYAEYDLALPVRPTENEEVSIYHEALKTAAARDEQQTTASIRKIAHAQALASLADTQIEVFIEHHLQTVGNMPVHHASALAHEPERLTVIAKRRSEIIRAEREKRITTAVDLLQQRDILTTSGIRKLSNKGALSPEMRLAHETANAAAQAVGWDEKTDLTIDVDNDDLNIAMTLAAEKINTEKLAKQRRGYLAVKFPDWTARQFQAALEQSESQLRLDGSGIEITAIDDDRFRGKLLTALLARLADKVFDSAALASVVREVLASDSSTGKTFGAEIASGALGASAYRRARFLHIADDDGVVDWVRAFLSEWYPARIAKNEDTYALCHAKNADLCLASFSRWLMHQPSVPDGVKIDLDLFETTELPDPDAELKNVARSRREAGETVKEIAESLNRNRQTVAKWCKGIKPPSPVEREVLELLGDGKVWKTPDIVERSRFAHRNVTTALKKLLDADKIDKIKRGFYQIQK